MNEQMGGGTGKAKKEEGAAAINRLLYNIVLRCTKEDGVRPYFDIGVWGYGGAAQVPSRPCVLRGVLHRMHSS